MRTKRINSLVALALIGLFVLAGCQKSKEIIFKNNDRYVGEVADGQPSGYGTMQYANQTTYTGTWWAGKPSGGGTLVFRNGDCYVGQMADGKRSGRGTLYKKNGQTINGTWAADTLSGYGVLSDSTARYEGQWQDEALDSGRIAYKNGYVYDGYIDQALREDGQGTMTYAEGSVYTGYWKGGKRSGFGIWMGADGRVKSGLWKDGEYVGELILHSKKRVYGIDISRHQHKKNKTIFWKKLQIVRLGRHHDAAADAALPLPVTFALIKATEGRGLVNPFFKNDYMQAHKHGIVRGAYHFFNASPVDLQIKNYINTVKLTKGDFPPILDLEPNKQQIAQMGGEEQMLSNALKWLEAVERHYGVRPILYVSQTFVTETLSRAPKAFRRYNYWIARYSAYSPAVDVNFWQLDDDGAVAGIAGPVDINLYNGSRAQFAHFLRMHGAR